MSSLERRTLSWLRDHHATISADVLAQFGVTLEQRKHLVETGVLHRVVDGAYSFAGAPETELTRCSALCTSRPQLVIAGPTAGRIWELRRSPRDSVVHVIAPPRSHPCQERWVRAYRTDLLFDDEVVSRTDGIRVTSPPRTVVDMTRYVDAKALESMIEDALHRTYCTAATMQRTALRLATPGRPWVRRFLTVLDRRHPGGVSESEAELRVLSALVDRGVTGLERQVRVTLPGYGPARFDLAIPTLQWALEVDLHPGHTTPSGVANDNVRDDGAEVLGWVTRRVGAVELSLQFDATIDRLVASIDRRRTDVRALRAIGRWPPRGER